MWWSVEDQVILVTGPRGHDLFRISTQAGEMYNESSNEP